MLYWKFAILSCYFLGHESVLCQVLHHSSFSKTINPLYLRSNVIYFAQKEPIKVKTLRIFSDQVKIRQNVVTFKTTNQFVFFCVTSSIMRKNVVYTFLAINFIYFQQKEPIKLQIWSEFYVSCQKPEILDLMTFFCPYHIRFQLKKYRRVISLDNEEWCTVYWKTNFWFQIWYEKIDECLPNHPKIWRLLFDGLSLCKVCKIWATKMQRGNLSWHWTVMQKLNKPWPCGLKNGMRNCVDFH